jgi:hypothetical protein
LTYAGQSHMIFHMGSTGQDRKEGSCYACGLEREREREGLSQPTDWLAASSIVV